jgi:hypothetical protein
MLGITGTGAGRAAISPNPSKGNANTAFFTFIPPRVIAAPVRDRR